MWLKSASRYLAVLCFSPLLSCTISGRAIIRNATSAEILLWPLGEFPSALKPGEATKPIVYAAYERQQAMIERRACLYTYPAPDYFNLPKEAKAYASQVVVVIEDDMTLHLHLRSREGAEGAEILVAGFPLKPLTFCGGRSKP